MASAEVSHGGMYRWGGGAIFKHFDLTSAARELNDRIERKKIHNDQINISDFYHSTCFLAFSFFLLILVLPLPSASDR